MDDSAVSRLGSRLFAAVYSDDHHEADAADRIVAWASKKYGTPCVPASYAAEPLVNHLFTTHGLLPEDTAKKSLEDLAAMVCDPVTKEKTKGPGRPKGSKNKNAARPDIEKALRGGTPPDVIVTTCGVTIGYVRDIARELVTEAVTTET